MIEKMKLKNQPKFREYKYIVLIVTGPLKPRKGSGTKSTTHFNYANSMREVRDFKKILTRGEKMLVFKANHDFIEGYEYK